MKYNHKMRPFSGLTASLLCLHSLCPFLLSLLLFMDTSKRGNAKWENAGKPTEVSMRFLVDIHGNAKASGPVLSSK